MKFALVAHVESFHTCKKTIPALLRALKEVEASLTPIKISWMLEQDEMRPWDCEIRSRQDGRVIEQGGAWFSELAASRPDELGIHVHFTHGRRFDPSLQNQARLIRAAHKKFVESFECEPRAFVGGWWYSNATTIKILEQLKFKVDASPMPLYKESRRRWLWGKIPTPWRLTTCDWTDCMQRAPWRPDYKNVCKQGRAKILYVPNAVDPKAKANPVAHLISLDLLDTNFNAALTAFKNFVAAKIPVVTIPFHPHALTSKKIEVAAKFFDAMSDTAKLSFVTLGELA